ncbi:MAG TPA: divalent metal cation transporter, partial [Microthrixaceae bacterium]|nr:divalent metal cation transporter [Microthrixaceae bacterium]
ANAEAGARFDMNLAWVVFVGVVGIVVYAEMAGRIAACAGRPVFDLVRERLGPRFGMINLVASFAINVLTLIAELAGVSIAISLVVSVNYLFLVPVVAFLVWLVVWRMRFSTMERVFGLAGLALIVFAVAVVRIGPDWSDMVDKITHPSVPAGEGIPTYAFYGVALFGAAMTPYEVFFFSSGAVEDGWTAKDLGLNRANVYLGFPLGGLLSLAIMASAHLLFSPTGISVEHLSQVPLPVAAELGKLGLAAAILGIFAATFGAALETTLSAGYIVSQYFGWEWGKYRPPRAAARFHVVMIVSLAIGVLVAISGVDPIKVTEYSIVLSAAALPLTYFPILVIANDPNYMGERTNGRILNGLATVYLGILGVVGVAAIPLLIFTRGGQ